MEMYLRYGLSLFGFWIITTRIISSIYLVFKGYADFVMRVTHYDILFGISTIAGLLAVVAGIVILVELRDTGRDIKRIALTFLGLTLILVGAYNVLYYAVVKGLIPGASVAADSHVVLGWISQLNNVLRVFHGIAAVLIIVSLQAEGSVAKIGLLSYSIITIVGIAIHFLGIERSLWIGLILALLGVLAGLLILKRQ